MSISMHCRNVALQYCVKVLYIIGLYHKHSQLNTYTTNCNYPEIEQFGFTLQQHVRKMQMKRETIQTMTRLFLQGADWSGCALFAQTYTVIMSWGFLKKKKD